MNKQELRLHKQRRVFAASKPHTPKSIFKATHTGKRKIEKNTESLLIENQSKLIKTDTEEVRLSANGQISPFKIITETQPIPYSQNNPKSLPDPSDQKLIMGPHYVNIKSNDFPMNHMKQDSLHNIPNAIRETIIIERMTSIFGELQSISRYLAADYSICESLATIDPTVLIYWHNLRGYLITLNQIAHNVLLIPKRNMGEGTGSERVNK